MGIVKTYWKIIVGAVLVLLVGVVLIGGKAGGMSEEERMAEEARQQAAKELEEFNNGGQVVDEEATDQLLLQSQESLRRSFGTPPEGFIWTLSGETLSLGDKKMEPEDVVYAYLQSLSKLTIDTAEFYSRESDVVGTYKEFYSDTYNASGDYKADFDREIYKQSMMSLEVLGVENTAVFAENKNTYSVRGRMIDLSNKSFWEGNKEEVFDKLYYLDTAEADSAKKDEFIYNMILNYYQSEGVQKKEFTFDVTVERYPDLNSGWLVSSDQALDSEFKYKDGNEVVNYVDQQYQQYKLQRSIDESRG